MSVETEKSMTFRPNYFAEGDYLSTDVRKGVMRNRAGTRMLALTDDFLRGLWNALDTECGPAAATVLKSCGKRWGRNYAKRFSRELEDYYQRPVREFPLPMFETYLTEAFAHHGWGKLKLDYSRYHQGIIVLSFVEAVYGSLVGKSTGPVDHLLSGVLAGMFAELTGEELDCLQTACISTGEPESRFIVSLGSRIKKVADRPAQGKDHAAILQELSTIRA